MNSLWVFNPENDIALGHNLLHFTPPRNALLLRNYGAMIVAWLADDGDYILAGHDNEKWLNDFSLRSHKNLKIFSPEDAPDIVRVQPWGWSKALINDLLHLGINPDILPGLDSVDDIRRISHRHSSVIINSQLRDLGFKTTLPLEVSDIPSLEDILNGQYPVVIKSPWSSSGRGVIFSDGMNRAQLIKLATGILKNQGCVLVEPKLNRILDFAMLFEMKDGVARFIGLSVFETATKGNYAGNIVADEPTLERFLAQYIDIEKINSLKSPLCQILSNLIGNSYQGICGVDMMIYKSQNAQFEIAPCIELNLRCTMGYVAHQLAKQLLSPGTTARMEISYIANREKSTSTHLPNGRAIFNRPNLPQLPLSLIPPNNSFQFTLSPLNLHFSNLPLLWKGDF